MKEKGIGVGLRASGGDIFAGYKSPAHKVL